MNLIQVTAENRSRIRAYYLSLCDQGRANFLYDNAISCGSLQLDPEERPKRTPLHRACVCGGAPTLRGSAHSAPGEIYIQCPACGCRSVVASSKLWAWYAWDLNKLFETENYTIWDALND